MTKGFENMTHFSRAVSLVSLKNALPLGRKNASMFSESSPERLFETKGESREEMVPPNSPDKARKERRALANIPAELAALERMTVAELRDKWQEVNGKPTTASNKAYLQKRLAWRIQELAEGGLSERAKQRIQELLQEAPLNWRKVKKGQINILIGGANKRDRRLPEVGSTLVRIYNRVEHRVKILEDGFEYMGERYETLSAVAKAITGAHWNGYYFFNLSDRRKKARKVSKPNQKRKS